MIDNFRDPDYEFLANYYECDVEFEGEIYKSLEHAFQAAKTTDTTERENIRYAENARVAKRIGRSIQLRDGWDDMREDIMRELLFAKFRSSEMKQKLLSTVGQELFFSNTINDTFWGVCSGIGENRLGELLMEVRDHFVSHSVGKLKQAQHEFLEENGWNKVNTDDYWSPDWDDDEWFALNEAVDYQLDLFED